MSEPSLHYEVPGLRVVDTWMQLVDRLIVCRLKQFHFSRDTSKAEEATAAMVQAEELTEAAMLYLAECLDGHRKPRVHQHLRFHQHATEEVGAVSLGEVISGLTACHARYWQAQGEVISIRQRVDASLGTVSHNAMLYEDLDRQQRVCDGCNQQRNELIQRGDELLRQMFEGPRGKEGIRQ